MILDLIMIGLLAWQIWMPAVDNAKYSFQIDRDGSIVRMNTQDGSMDRCSADLRCEAVVKPQDKELDYKY